MVSDTLSAPILERTDAPSLALGYAPSSCRTVNIVGLDLKVYGLDELASSSKPLAAVIATHGRCNSQKETAHFAHGVIGHIGSLASSATTKRDVIVITLDQRNHGERCVNRTANLAYDKNPNHLVDMAACVVGGCQDVAFIIDFLESYLFPNGEKKVEEWIATGISLGGNLTWRLLQSEPRIRIAIPIIGLPWDVFPLYLQDRAEKMGFSFSPPLYPPALAHMFPPRPSGCYAGKKILSLHGGVDTVVPYPRGAQQIEQARVEAVQGGGEMEVWVQEGVGHAVSTEMLRRVAEWVWRFAIKAES